MKPIIYMYLIMFLFAYPCHPLAKTKIEYDHEVDHWVVVSFPTSEKLIDHMLFYSAANTSKFRWRTYLQNNKILAETEALYPYRKTKSINIPKFKSKLEQLGESHRFYTYTTHPVKDGWLVGYHGGEFGGMLCWFSNNGEKFYKISEHYVIVDFIVVKNHIYAIEGVSHLGGSHGSLIRIDFNEMAKQWVATAVMILPSAPFAAILSAENILYIVLHDALVAVNDLNSNELEILMKGKWDGLYPSSVALSSDETNLYIGMRQFVGNYNLNSKKFRFLIPDTNMLNKLPKESEEKLRKQYGEELWDGSL